MNKILISSCFHSRFPIIAAVIRCYFTRENRKLIRKSTGCRSGTLKSSVITANTAATPLERRAGFRSAVPDGKLLLRPCHPCSPKEMTRPVHCYPSSMRCPSSMRLQMLSRSGRMIQSRGPSPGLPKFRSITGGAESRCSKKSH